MALTWTARVLDELLRAVSSASPGVFVIDAEWSQLSVSEDRATATFAGLTGGIVNGVGVALSALIFCIEEVPGTDFTEV